jgi:RimJ/RimL family protein N-acetyltransferase
MYFGRQVKLRNQELDDTEAMYRYWNDLEVKQFSSTALPHSREEIQERIKKSWEFRKKGTDFYFAVTTLDDEFLGTCGLHIQRQISRSADLGVFIMDKSQWDRGYGTDIIEVLCGIAFQILNLQRLELEVYDFNTRAIRVYEKIGFRPIGTRRRAYYMLGKYVDALLMDLLKEEFENKYPDFTLHRQE